MSSYASAFFLDIFFNTKNREKYLILFLKKKNYEMMPYDEKKNVFSSKEYTPASYLYSCLKLHSKNSSLVFILHIYIKMNVLLSFVPIYNSVNMFQVYKKVFYGTRINKAHTHMYTCSNSNNKICNFAFLLTSKLVVLWFKPNLYI